MNVDPRFDYSHTTLFRCNQAVIELFYISEVKPTREEAAFASSHIFGVYGVALHYLFNAEYNKLTELKASSKFPNNHIASLPLLNEFLLKQEGESFSTVYDSNRKELSEITSSTFTENKG